MKTFQDIHKLVKTLAELDIDNLWWRTEGDEVKVYVNCNDIFFWGCSDVEDIEVNDVELLKEVHEQLEAIKTGLSAYWIYLYCSRKRKMQPMQPQGAVYKCIPKEMWNLINECGEEREIDISNPYNQNLD